MPDHSIVPEPPTGTDYVCRELSDLDIAELLDRAQRQFYHASTYIPHGLYTPEQWGNLANTCKKLGDIEPSVRRRGRSAIEWSRP